jgi:predicted dinucleotide-binding enzyme
MNIGIIGAGNIGGNLARRFRGLGHQVFVANSRGPESREPSPRSYCSGDSLRCSY